jgi:hypothetical protein
MVTMVLLALRRCHAPMLSQFDDPALASSTGVG